MTLRCDHVAPTDAYAGCCFICAGASDTPAPSRRGMLAAAATAPFLAAAPAQAQARPKAPRPPDGTYIVQAGWAVVLKDTTHTLVRDVEILVRDGVIAEVSTTPLKGKFPRVDARQLLVMPGFISGHTHVCSGTPTRGLIETGRSYRQPLQYVEQLGDDELDALTAANLAELLRSGCTTQVEMSLTLRQAESYVRVAKKWGVRGYPGPMIPNTTRLWKVWFRKTDDALFESEPETLQEIAAALEFARRHMNANGGLIRPMMAPHATDTHTEKTMAALATAVRELGTGLHIHLSQSRAETDKVKQLWGLTPAQWLGKFGFYDFPVFGAHMMGLDWAVDPAVLNAGGAVYAHCPSAGGAGATSQPYPEALAAGMKVNIAIDTHSNDYLENLKLSVLVGRLRARLLRRNTGAQVKEPTLWDAVNGATLIPAQAMKRDDLGRIAPGARADLTMIDVSGLLVGSGALPPEPLSNLLYANGKMVRHVVTDGRFQLFDGQLIVGDEAEIAAAGGRVVAKIWKQLADEDWFEKERGRG